MSGPGSDLARIGGRTASPGDTDAAGRAFDVVEEVRVPSAVGRKGADKRHRGPRFQGTTSAESRASDHRRNRTGTTESVSSSQPVAAAGAAADPDEDASSRPRGGAALKKKSPDQLVRHYTDLFSGVDGAERGTVHFERADEKIADQLYEPGPPVRYIDGERYVYLKAKPPGSQVIDKDGNEVDGGHEDQEDGGTTSATSDGAGSYEPPSYIPPSPDITSKDKDVMASWEQRLHSMDKRHKEKDAADQLRQLDNLRRLAELEKSGGGSSAGRGAGKKNAAALALAAENAEMMRAASAAAAKPEAKNADRASGNKMLSYEERIRSMEGRQLAREEYDAQRLTDLAEAVRQHEAQQPESFEQKLQMQSMKQANKRGARVPTMIPKKTGTFSFGSLDSNGNVRRSPPTAPRFFEEQHLPVKPRDPSVVGDLGTATAPVLGESATAADGGAVVVAKDRNIVVPRDPSAMVRPSIDDWHPKLSATTAGTSPASGRREVWHSVPVIPTERPPTAGDGGSGSGDTAEVESFSDMKTVNPNVKNSSTSAWTSTTAATNVGSPKQEGPRGKEHRVEAATNSYLGGSRCRVGSTSKNKGGALAEDDTILVDQLGSPVEEQAPDEDVTRGDKHKNAVDLYGNIPPANFSLEWPDTRASFGGDNTGVDGGNVPTLLMLLLVDLNKGKLQGPRPRISSWGREKYHGNVAPGCDVGAGATIFGNYMTGNVEQRVIIYGNMKDGNLGSHSIVTGDFGSGNVDPDTCIGGDVGLANLLNRTTVMGNVGIGHIFAGAKVMGNVGLRNPSKSSAWNGRVENYNFYGEQITTTANSKSTIERGAVIMGRAHRRDEKEIERRADKEEKDSTTITQSGNVTNTTVTEADSTARDGKGKRMKAKGATPNSSPAPDGEGIKQQPSRGGQSRRRHKTQPVDDDVKNRAGASVFADMFGPLYFRASFAYDADEYDTAPTTDFDDDEYDSMENAAPGGFYGRTSAAAAGSQGMHYAELLSGLGLDDEERGTVHFERAEDEQMPAELQQPGPAVRYINGEKYVYLKAPPRGSRSRVEGELSSSARPGDRRALGAAMLFFDDNEENTFIGSGAAVSDSQAVFRSTQGAPESDTQTSDSELESNPHEAAMEDALGLVNRNRNDEFLDNRGSGEYSAFPSKLLHNSAKTEPLNLPSAIWFNDVQDREDAGTSRETDNPIAQAQRVLVDEDSKGTSCPTGVASEAHYEPPVRRGTFPTTQEAPAELRERRAQRLKYFRGRGSNRQSLFDAPLFGSPVFGRFQAYETSGLQAPARLVNGIVFTAPGQTFEKLKAEQETEPGFQHTVPHVEYFDRALHDKEALKRRKAREERRKQWSPLTPLARFPRPPGVVHKKPASERELQVRERQKLMQKLGPNLDKVLRADAGASTSPVTIRLLPGGHLREVNVDGSPSDSWSSWSPTASREKRRGFVVSPRQGLGAVNGGPHQGLGGSAAPHSPTSSQFSFSPAVSRVRRLGQAVQNVGPEAKTMQETTTSARQMERLIADFSGANMDNDLEDVVSADVAAATRKDRAPAFLGPQVRYEDTASSGTTAAGRIAPEMIVKDARLAPLRGSLMHPEARGGDTGEQPKPGDTTNSLVPADERRCSAWPLQKQAASFQRDHLDVLADLEKTLETARLGAKSVVWQKRKRLKMRSAVTHVTEHPYAEERVFVATENGNWGLIRLFSAEAEVEEAATDSDPSVGGEAEVFCQRAHQKALTSIAAHRRGLRLVTTGKDRYMHVWAVDDCTVPLSTTITPHLTHASACHDFSDFFATADGDGLVRVYDLNRGVTTNMPPSVTIRGHTECVESVCFQNFGNEILTAAQDGMASIFDMRSGLCVATFGHFSMINGEQRSRRRSKQECVASAGRSRIPGGSLSPRVAPFAGSQIVSSAVYSPDNSMILTAEERGVCRLWDRRKGGKQAGPCSDELLRIDCSGGGDPVLSAAFDTTGDTISVCCPSEVLVFSLADGGFTQAIGSASRHAFFTDACFTRENRTLVAAYSGGLVLCDGVVDA
eukprot:g7843.t1